MNCKHILETWSDMSFLHLSDYLTQDSIKGNASSFGFAESTFLEKFIMDFELYFHISQKMDCFTRGGMCMPFHTSEDLRRLSIDIDIVTKLKNTEINSIMEEIARLPLDLKINPIKPRNAYPIPNLLSYYVEYTSCFGKLDGIKVDFLCEANVDLPHKMIDPGFRVFNCNLDFPVSVLNHGGLIGDKITTMSLEKIGLPEHHFTDIPKQIYDIATLLKLTNPDILRESFEVFQRFTDFKVEIYKREPSYTSQEVMNSINSSLEGFLHFEPPFSITVEQNSRYNNFRNRYLSHEGEQYKKTEHITDILLVWLYSKYLSRYLNNPKDIDSLCTSYSNALANLMKVKEFEGDSLKIKRREFLGQLPRNISFNKNIFNGSSLEHVYLIKEIFNEEKIQLEQ